MSTTPGPAAVPTPPNKLGLSRNMMIGIGAGCGCLALIVGIIVIFFVFAAVSGGRPQQGGGQQPAGGGGQPSGGGQPAGGGQPSGGGQPAGGGQPSGGGQPAGGGQPGGGGQQGQGVPGIKIPLVMVRVTGTAEKPQDGEPTDVFGSEELIGGRGQFDVVQGAHEIMWVYIKEEGGRVVPVKKPHRMQINEQMQGDTFRFIIGALPAGEYGFAVFKVAGQDQFQMINGRVFRVQ